MLAFESVARDSSVVDRIGGDLDNEHDDWLFADRILLRPFLLSDVTPYVDQQDSVLAEGFGWDSPVDMVGMRAVAERWVAQWAGPRLERNFAIIERRSDRLVGDCELELRSDGFVHIMYGILPTARGKGYASDAVQLLLDHRRTVWPNMPLLFRINANNAPSIALARRAGAAFDHVERTVEGRELQRWVLA